MTPTITYIGLAIAVAVLIVANVPWGKLGGLLPKIGGGESKPDRDAAVKAYDTLKAYLADGDPDLKAIWGKLS